MLVLSRRIGETIVIDGGIKVTVVGVQGQKVRLGIEAPGDVRVDREEIRERRMQDVWCGEEFAVAHERASA